MIRTRPIRGVVPVLLTPFTPEEKIDEAALRRLVEFLNTKEIGGLWVLGTGSEDMNLTFAKRLEVARIAAEANRGRTPLVLGAGFFALEDILDFIRETRDLEFDAYHVMPYHPLLSLDRLDWFYRHIADHCPKPLWLYTSANWARPITPEFVAGLKDHPNIAGVKFSTRDTLAQAKVIALAEEGFQVITAVASQFYPCLCLGSQAHTSSLASCLPESMIPIYQSFLKGDHAGALARQRKLNAFLEVMGRNTKKDNFLQAADEKYILHLRGLSEPYVSSYYRPTDEGERERLRRALDDFDLIAR
ncbi:MAG: dihydrodipicolinate synthase family protein [Thermodesulfobacteriota bacterium]